MTLYNLLFGESPVVDVLLGILKLTREDAGRFRDAYVEIENDQPVIVVYTRNGGGNRDHWGIYMPEAYEEDAGENCSCPGCIITYRLPKHPNYLSDKDDDDDPTYAEIRFSVPEKFRELALKIAEAGRFKGTPQERWQDLLHKLQITAKTADTSDPDVAHALSVIRPVMEKITKALEDTV